MRRIVKSRMMKLVSSLNRKVCNKMRNNINRMLIKDKTVKGLWNSKIHSKIIMKYLKIYNQKKMKQLLMNKLK